jgi:hypothetical protein
VSDENKRWATPDDFLDAGFEETKTGREWSIAVMLSCWPWTLTIERYGTLPCDRSRWRFIYFQSALYFNTIKQFQGLCYFFHIEDRKVTSE